ncbi:MAG: DUF2142 domain-containing protein [Methanobrevibacter millerae]|uniref:DUF2142 domain-containing protein n=1 Tax=Methanobrevibacter millerae TaxID=230361 RepID=A0A8T3VJE7_9EURY|nr:DUF2142 domain-containing protein [Methanobrevibacter millerae]MBE6504800.1 DUF2142 domain-containing protein [Methanobrevibacter millerae]
MTINNLKSIIHINSQKNLAIFSFIIITLIATFSVFSIKNYLFPYKELLVLIYVIISGVISLLYYFKTKSIHRTAVIIILLFGIMFVFLSPINSISDEKEHLIRSEITSRGVLVPEYITQGNESGFISIDSIKNSPKYISIYETDWDSGKINETEVLIASSFEQNPFYAYIAPAIGIGLAKLLNLDNIWLLWLGRICNLLMYATLCGIAIKKTPMLKLPMAIVACFPLSISQAASISCDCFIFSFTFIAFAYLFHMYKSKNLSKRNIIIYTSLVLILAISKITFASLILLLFFIPKENYKNEKYYLLSFLSLTIIFGITLIWSKYFAMNSLLHSWRSIVFEQNNVNATLQMQHILNNPLEGIIPFLHMGDQIPHLVNNLSKLYIKNDSFPLFNYFYSIFALFFCLFYPVKEKISSKSKIILLLTLLILLFGTYFVQYLTWAPVGAINLDLTEVMPRYFLPTCVLLPLIFSINKNKKIKNLHTISFTIIVSSLSSVAMFFVSMFY